MSRPHFYLAAMLAGLSVLAPAARADEEGPGHVHGPDGRHIAVAPEGGSAGAQVLSHHDLRITDTSRKGPDGNGAVVEGAEVHSVIHRKGDPQAVVHREANAYEPEHGVYGSHMMYREPGEYVIVETVTLPGGKQYTLEFPIWVPDPEGGTAAAASTSPLLYAAGGLAVLLLLAAAFLLGRRSGRKTAAKLSLLWLAFALAPLGGVRADGEEAGHMHGPDGRHIAVAETFGEAGTPLRAYLGPNGETEAVLERDRYRFTLSIENEELEQDPDLVSLDHDAAELLGLQTVPAASRPLAGGLSTTGQVRPNPNGAVTVNTRVGGRVLRVYVTPGQRIPAGHLVAVIDSTEIAEAQAALSRAQAEQRSAEAVRVRTRAEVRRVQSQVGEAEAALARAEAQLAEARAEAEHERAELAVARGKVESARQALQRQQQLAAAGAFAQGPVETARSAVAAAEGELQEGQAALTNVEAQARRLEQGLKDGVVARKELEAAQSAASQGRTRVRTAERQLQLARTALAREERIQRESLRDAREVQAARAEVESAELQARSAEAAVTRRVRSAEAAEALVASQRRAVETAREQVAGARAETQAAEAAAGGARQAVRAALNRLQLLGGSPSGSSQVRITAPIGGEVHSRPVNTGQVVGAGETLCSVVNTGTVWVESDVFEKDLPRIREGQRVTIAADAVPGRTFAGTVSSIEYEVDPETRAVHVRTVVPNPNGLLKPNMFVRVVISSGTGSAVVIPVEALQERGGEQLVFVREAEGAYRRRVVRVGPALGDQVVIEAGLKPGEPVVTRGAYQLLAKLGK
ncbi:MAG: efflux RND transporter periplasmic adaptor subunit [Armatimonadota bacterium]